MKKTFEEEDDRLIQKENFRDHKRMRVFKRGPLIKILKDNNKMHYVHYEITDSDFQYKIKGFYDQVNIK